MKIARIYERISSSEQDLSRQAAIEKMVTANRFYFAGIYWEKASGARADRPELLTMIADFQPGEVVIVEKRIITEELNRNLEVINLLFILIRQRNYLTDMKFL
ncbi:recombinase family protein [Xenorhabdus budapestensis]|uniref:Recombinase family protein n=1 Tax=Xenorhabdus budapestensis TaxID=290110 RepID=A0A2D0J3I3_XENBU|nr:resolvase [Xenorhabdus budapestensis]QTL40084.1 recombinase family protein [Xenorhabdus budapestensis]